jgi:hypothetical protein
MNNIKIPSLRQLDKEAFDFYEFPDPDIDVQNSQDTSKEDTALLNPDSLKGEIEAYFAGKLSVSETFDFSFVE